MNAMRTSSLGVAACVMALLVACFGPALSPPDARGEQHRPVPLPAQPEAIEAHRPVLTVMGTGALEGACDVVGSIASRLLDPLLGADGEAARPAAPPTFDWWTPEADVPGASRLVVGLDLNALRRQSPDRFADQRLNQALLELGLANARGVVVEVVAGPEDAAGDPMRAWLTVSYRDWDATRGQRVALWVAHPEAGANRLALRAHWGAWIDSLVACHRALLDPLDRSPFDAAHDSWRRRHEQKVRQVIASIDGPVLLGAGDAHPYALLGLGGRADHALTMRNLGTILTVLGAAQYDPRSGVGRATIDALEGTGLGTLECRIVRRGTRDWILVAPEGAGDALARELGD